MAQLAFAGVGAIIGGTAAYAYGAAATTILAAASVGLSVGAVVGQAVTPLPAGPISEGARLNDLTVQTSTYGVAIPEVLGHVRLSGNMIWSTPIREEKQVSGGGGGKGLGKGGGGGTQITYLYHGTFAIGFCKGPASAVLRVWADNKLVYDASSGQDTIAKFGFAFRFYPGSEDQLPDSLIEADRGVGNVPAFRGLCYIVFTDIPLTDYGNRIPNISVELAMQSEPAYLTQEVSLLGGAPNISLGNDLAVDRLRKTAYGVTNGTLGLAAYDIPSAAEFAYYSAASLGLGITISAVTVGLDGNLYTISASGLWQINPGIWSPTSYTTTVFSPLYLVAWTVPSLLDQYDFLLISSQFDSTAEILNAKTGDSMTDALPVTFELPGLTLARTRGLITLNYGEVFVLSAAASFFTPDMTQVYVNKVRTIIEKGGGIAGAPSENVRIDNDIIATIQASDIDASATHFKSIGFFVYDVADGDVVLVCSLRTDPSGTAYGTFAAKIDNSSGTLVWIKQIPGLTTTEIGNTPNTRGDSYVNGNLGFLASSSYVINTVDGTVSQTSGWETGAGILTNSTSHQVWDSETQTLLVGVFGHHEYKCWIERRLGSDVTLGDVYSHVCALAGMDSADVDVTSLTDPVTGWISTDTDSAAAILNGLGGIYFVDAVEADGQLQFLRRGASAVLTLAEDDLVRTEGAQPYQETRRQEAEMPAKVTVSFLDVDRDFQVNSAPSKRTRQPDPAVFSDNRVDLAAGMIMDLETAMRFADRAMRTAWMDRRTFAVQVPPKYCYLRPADPVTLTLNDGSSLRVRLGKTDIGADFSTQTVLIAETAAQYTSAITAPSVPVPTQTIGNPSPSALFLLDTPLLRDVDDTGGTAIRAYWGGAYYTDTTWPGAILQGSADGTAYDDIDYMVDEVAWGTLETAPDDPPSMWRYQDETFIVRMTAGGSQLASVNDVQLLNGANAAAVVATDGTVEVLQFRDVTALGNRRYELSTLLRGRRGTDTMAPGRAAGERFILLSTSTIGRFTVPQAFRNIGEWYRAVTAGTLPEQAIVQGFTFHGRDQMPYAPVYHTAGLSGGDILLGWTRRTRVNGGLRGGTGDVPLGETTESYEIDILSGPGGSVLRTLTSTTNAKTYTSAQITADFGSAPATLSFTVYQMSATVGRGFPGAATVTVT